MLNTVLRRMPSSAKQTPKSSDIDKLWPQHSDEQQSFIADVLKALLR